MYYDSGMRVVIIVVVLLVVGAGAGAIIWASGNHAGQVNTDSSRIAIKGYDPVAYFTREAPVAGRSEYSHEWNNATWLFSTAEHRDRFAADPEAYAPAYGGYCAWAIAEGTVAGINPDMWHIEEGRLYLNFSARTNRRFLNDVSGNIARAEGNWPDIRARLESKASQ